MDKGVRAESGDDGFNDVPVDVCEAEITASVAKGELFVIQPKQMEDRSVKIVHVDLVFDRLVTVIVCLAVA